MLGIDKQFVQIQLLKRADHNAITQNTRTHISINLAPHEGEEDTTTPPPSRVDRF